MASGFWDAEGILCIDYLEKGKTITGEYYSNLLTRPYEKIRKTQFAKGKMFHQDNAPVHNFFFFLQWEN
jgi:hypothetical protein